jgi:hypothetical protein
LIGRFGDLNVQILDFGHVIVIEGIDTNYHYIASCRYFFDAIAEELQIADVQDWYRVSYNQIAQRGGMTLLQHVYLGSHIRAITEAYPDTHWQLWKFESTSKHLWKSIIQQREYFNWLEER